MSRSHRTFKQKWKKLVHLPDMKAFAQKCQNVWPKTNRQTQRKGQTLFTQTYMKVYFNTGIS